MVPSPKVNVLGVFNLFAISTLAPAKLISTLDAAVILPLASKVTTPTWVVDPTVPWVIMSFNVSANPTFWVPSKVFPTAIISSALPSPKVNVRGVSNFLATSAVPWNAPLKSVAWTFPHFLLMDPKS